MTMTQYAAGEHALRGDGDYLEALHLWISIAMVKKCSLMREVVMNPYV